MEAAGDEPMSKDMKGRLGLDERGGWKGAVGRRRWGPAVLGLPPDGKITGGTVNSFFDMMVMLEFCLGDLETMNLIDFLGCLGLRLTFFLTPQV